MTPYIVRLIPGRKKNRDTSCCVSIVSLSGKRESDPRHPPWQGGALPLSYFRINLYYRQTPLIERKTGVGPATSTLARWRSTTELFPHKSVVVKKCGGRDLNSHAEAPDPKSGVSANSTTPAGVKSFKSCDYGKLEYRKL